MKCKSVRFLSLLLAILLVSGILADAGLTEAAVKEDFAPGIVHHGFRTYQVEQIDYMGLDIYFMEHEKTGAQLIYAACDDPERAFGVSFRTQSRNDEGLPHVFEHSALSGCEKYPDSNLVFSMINQTYNTYINAETRQLATLYPISSLSEEQLFADMDLYMNGVLYPILLKDERAMMREAWHYNLDDPEGDITISGVVYSEMAANYGIMQYAADGKLRKMLFPGSYSANDCGGDPAVIPDMTYQELLDFHATYYQPSNMLLMLYGDFEDIDRFLEHLDSEYLSKYDRSEVIYDDPDYTPASGYQELYYNFPATRSAETDHATYIDYAFVLKDMDKTDYALASIAANTLSMESSPLKQRMDELFPLSTFSPMIDDNTVEPTLHFTLYNAEVEDAPAFKAAIDELIPVIIERGIDESVVDLMINSARYAKATVREGAETGVILFGAFADAWSKTGRPDAYMEEVRIIDELEKYKKDGIINAVLGKYLPNAPASAMIVATPEPGAAEKNAEALAAKLAEMKAAMSEEEVRALVDECADYNAWIENNAKVSLIDQMKVVDAATLPEEYETASVTDETKDGVRYISSVVPDCEVFDMNIYLDAQGIPFENLLDAMLLSTLLGQTGTENYSKEALQSEMLGKLNALSFYLNMVYDQEAPAHQYLQIMTSGLNEQLDDTFRLTEEIVLHMRLDDYDTIRKAASDYAMMVDLYVNFYPDAFLDTIGKAVVDPEYYADYLLGSSPEFKRYFENIARMSDAELAEVVGRMRDTLTYMLNRPGAIVTAVGSAETVERCFEGADAFLGKLGSETCAPVDYASYSTLKGGTAFVIDTTVAYDYIFFDMDAAGEELTGQRLVAKSVVRDLILLPELRFRNNAYGASNAIDENFAYLSSYRDPNVSETYEVFASIPEKLRALELTEEQLKGYITSAYSDIVTPRGPIARADEAVDDALKHSNPERKLRWIREIKASTAEDIRTVADLYERIITEGTVVAGISEEMLASTPGLFETILRRSEG